MARREDVECSVGDEPILSFKIEQETDAGVSSYPLAESGLDIKLFIKNFASDADADAIAVYGLLDNTGVTLTDASAGEGSVQVTSSATAVKGAKVYKLRIYQAGGAHPVTPIYGAFVVSER